MKDKGILSFSAIINNPYNFGELIVSAEKKMHNLKPESYVLFSGHS